MSKEKNYDYTAKDRMKNRDKQIAYKWQASQQDQIRWEKRAQLIQL